MSTEEPMSIEDRIRTATQARASLVHDIRPLAEPGRVRSRRRPAPPARRWLSWGVPLAAAAAVVVLALSLVAVRGSHSGSPAGRPTGTATGQPAVPRYYAAIDDNASGNSQDGPLIVGDSRTGQVIDTISPPRGLQFVNVQGGSDDRTFVVMADRPSAEANVTWYLLRIAPGAARPYQFTRLPVSNPHGLRDALSPDGRELAIESQASGSSTNKPTTVTLYSMSSGAELRAWTTPMNILSGPAQATLSWLPDGRQLAFSVLPSTAASVFSLQLRTLDVTGAGTDLMAASQVLLTVRSPSSSPSTCDSLHLTPDGGTVICGTQYAFTNGGPGTNVGCAAGGLAFTAYSIPAGQPVRVLYQYRGACHNGLTFLLWTDASARQFIGAVLTDLANEGGKESAQLGVITHGHLTPLKLPTSLPATDYGTIAF